jgi:glycosyltransferase involved in cell wall biosynthesis
VAIVHPWFPQYRAEFFHQLQELCGPTIDLDVYHGDPPPEWRERGDAVRAPGVTRLPTRFFRLGGRSLSLKDFRPIARGKYDLIVLEQAIRNLETFILLAGPRSGNRIAFWGHGRTYTLAKSAGEERLKMGLTRRAKWFFAYTGGGARHVVANGFARDRVTVVNNSIDTAGLRRDLDNVDSRALRRFESDHGLRGKTAIYLGGLDESKRLPFLLDAAAIAHQRDPDFRLLVVGDGAQRNLVKAFASDNPWAVYLGRRFGADRALPLKAAQVMVMPGRVGLAAVDSFAAEVPIITTDWPLHAPEYEYLRPGLNAVVTRDDSGAYVQGLVDVLNDPSALEKLRLGCAEASGIYSVEQMARNFFEGLEAALLLPSPRSRKK